MPEAGRHQHGTLSRWVASCSAAVLGLICFSTWKKEGWYVTGFLTSFRWRGFF